LSVNTHEVAAQKEDQVIAITAMEAKQANWYFDIRTGSQEAFKEK
jgi:hypothetical protein